MAGGIDISLIGDKALERTFAKLPDAMQKKVIRGANTKAVRVILKAVKDRTPVRTGALKKGIKSRAGKRSRHVVARYVVLPRREELGIAADDKYYWPAALEYGHDNVPPHSYLRAGFDAVESQALAVLKREIGVGVEREAKKL